MPVFRLPASQPLSTTPPGRRPLPHILLGAGLLQLGIWLFACLRELYAGSGGIFLLAQPTLAFVQAHQLRAHFVDTAAGGYFAGTRGELLYHASSLGDYFLFYSIGEVTGLDALFFAGLGLYLHRALRRLPAGPGYAPAVSRALAAIGLATLSMHVLKMMLAVAATKVFWAKTDHLFYLAGSRGGSSPLYVLFGLLLLLCAALFRHSPPAAPSELPS